jgi:hypothetical protein
MQSAADEHGQHAASRRRAIQHTWLPLVREQPGFLAQFVLGRPANPTPLNFFRRDRHLKRDFLFLEIQVCGCKTPVSNAWCSRCLPC